MRSFVTAAAIKLKQHMSDFFFFPFPVIILSRFNQFFPLEINFFHLDFPRCTSPPSLVAQLNSTTAGQEAIRLGINVTRNNKVLDTDTPEPSQSPVTLASRHTMIREQRANGSGIP